MPKYRTTFGVGSNQYATRPGHDITAPRSRTTATATAVLADEEDPEAVAWVFSDESSEWRNAGFTWAEKNAWQAVLGDREVPPAELRRFEDLVGGPEVGQWWQQNGRLVAAPDVPMGEVSAPWPGLGLRPERDRWVVHGFGYGRAKAWHEEGFSLDEAFAWQTAGFGPKFQTSTDHEDSCKAARRVRAWIASGFTDPQEAGDWLTVMSAWRTTDTELPVGIPARWHKAGFTADEASLWQRLGFGITEAKKLRGRDLTPWLAYLAKGDHQPSQLQAVPPEVAADSDHSPYIAVRSAHGYGWHQAAADWHDGDPVHDGWMSREFDDVIVHGVRGRAVFSERYENGVLTHQAVASTSLSRLIATDAQISTGSDPAGSDPTHSSSFNRADLAGLAGDPRWAAFQPIASTRTTAEWIDAEFTPDEAWAWTVRGVKDPGWAATLRAYGYLPADPHPFDNGHSNNLAALRACPPPLHRPPA